MQYYPYQPPVYQPPVISQEMYQKQLYKKTLRRSANSIGGLLLVFFGLEIILALIVIIVLSAMGIDTGLSDTDMLSLLENGMLSSIIFFVSGLVYCRIRKLRFGDLFPFDKIQNGMLAPLCTIGLTFSLMSNYVVDLVNGSFSLFGIENHGGSIDAGSDPSVLLYFLTVAILPAFAEEFAFRGILMGVLRPYSEGLAILVSSAMFALMHGNFVQLPFTFCCGLVFAFIDIKTNSMLPSIIVHFFNNALSVLFDILISYKLLTNYGANLCYGFIFLVLGILSFLFIKRIIKTYPDFFKLDSGSDILTYKEKVKTVASSPSIISFEAIMVLYCVFALVQ